jgi:hypothetical protein
MYDPALWGTVAQWASGVGSTAAFWATFYIIRRDAKIRRRTQVRKVLFYHRVDSEGRHEVVLENSSDEAIHHIVAYGNCIEDTSVSFLAPANEVAIIVQDWPKFRREGTAHCTFIDNSDIRWRFASMAGGPRESRLSPTSGR